jgi:hypothetical protein
MRDHLITCLEEDTFTHFPVHNKRPRIALKRKQDFEIHISCNCGLADEYEDVVKDESDIRRQIIPPRNKIGAKIQILVEKCTSSRFATEPVFPPR